MSWSHHPFPSDHDLLSLGAVASTNVSVPAIHWKATYDPGMRLYDGLGTVIASDNGGVITPTTGQPMLLVENATGGGRQKGGQSPLCSEPWGTPLASCRTDPRCKLPPEPKEWLLTPFSSPNAFGEVLAEDNSPVNGRSGALRTDATSEPGNVLMHPRSGCCGIAVE